MKKTKKDLRQDTVVSDTFHVGIELELRSPSGNQCGEACSDNQRDYMENESTTDILENYLGLSRLDARRIESYFNVGDWINDYMNDWECDGDSCCSSEGDRTRDEMESELKSLTGNSSFKVVSDGSIKCDDEQTDTEVCWNYFASRETIKDNTKILKWLSDNGSDFNTSCGLHINLNRYLPIDYSEDLPTSDLAFLFDFVAASRATSTYCNQKGLGMGKDCMIYIQKDRLEFRFFSPTLDPIKLNHYVVLANTVYKRLAGKPAKLPKKSMEYFLAKMVETNGLTKRKAMASIKKVNSLYSYDQLIGTAAKVIPTHEEPCLALTA